jgi:hypothetical protein
MSDIVDMLQAVGADPSTATAGLAGQAIAHAREHGVACVGGPLADGVIWMARAALILAGEDEEQVQFRRRAPDLYADYLVKGRVMFDAVTADPARRAIGSLPNVPMRAAFEIRGSAYFDSPRYRGRFELEGVAERMEDIYSLQDLMTREVDASWSPWRAELKAVGRTFEVVEQREQSDACWPRFRCNGEPVYEGGR